MRRALAVYKSADTKRWFPRASAPKLSWMSPGG
jgi:hypothetical protein